MKQAFLALVLCLSVLGSARSEAPVVPPAATLLASVALVCEAGKLPYAVLFIFDNRPPSFFRLDSDELKIKALDVMKLGNQRISLIVDCDIQPDTAI